MQPGTPEEEWREDCAPRRVLELFATKWTSMILHTLHARHDGTARAGVLHRSLPGISKKMLTQTLREMEGSGLVSRHVHGTVPPAVDYQLTPLGQRLVEPVELLYGWARSNPDLLLQLRARPTSRRAGDDKAGDGKAGAGKAGAIVAPSGLDESSAAPARSLSPVGGARGRVGARQ